MEKSSLFFALSLFFSKQPLGKQFVLITNSNSEFNVLYKNQNIYNHCLLTGERPYKCIQCYKKFVSMGVLRQHLRTHTGVKEYICNICQASFTTNGSLTRHMNIHVAIKPFRCPVCLEAFRTASLCKKHMNEHEEDGMYG